MRNSPTRRVGVLAVPSAVAFAGRTDALRAGLREFGFAEGRNMVIEFRSGDGRFERMPAMAAELVRLNVDVIVTAGTPAIRAAKAATQKIPIVPTPRSSIASPRPGSSSTRTRAGCWATA